MEWANSKLRTAKGRDIRKTETATSNTPAQLESGNGGDREDVQKAGSLQVCLLQLQELPLHGG